MAAGDRRRLSFTQHIDTARGSCIPWRPTIDAVGGQRVVIARQYVGRHARGFEQFVSAAARGEIDVVVVEKIAGFSADRLESLLNEFLTKEFRFVEIIGAALGFLIGVLQILLTLLIK